MSKKGHIIITRVIGLLVFALLAVPVLIQVPAIQTRLTAKATSLLESVIDGKVSVGGIQIKLSGALAIRDVVLIDSHPYTDNHHNWAPVDTLAKIGLITGTMRVEGILKHEGIHLGRIHIQDGFFHLVSEPNDYKSNISRLLKVIPEEAPNPQEEYPVFDIRRIRLDNFSFRMNNYIIRPNPNDARSPYGIHFEDMDAAIEKIMVNNLKFAYGRMSGTLTRFKVSEKRGYHLNSLTAKFAVGTGLTSVQGLHLKDEWSDVTIDDFTMDYSKGTKAFMRFITDVRLAVSTDHGGRLDIRTISGICGALYGNESVYELRRVRAEGTIDDINVKNIRFKEQKTGLEGSLECRLGGLPDIQKFTLDGTIKDVAFTPVCGCDFTAFWAKNFKLHIPGKQKFLLNGSVHGLLSNLKIKVNAKSEESGTIDAEMLIKHIQDPAGRPISLGGSFSTDNLDVGGVCNNDNLGHVTMHSGLSLVLCSALPDIKLDSLQIDRFGFSGHDFSGISANGFKQGDKILVHFLSLDPDVSVNILADCEGEREYGNLFVNLAADINRANLSALGLDKRQGTSELSTKIDASLKSTDSKNLLALMDMGDLVLTNDDGRQNLGSISALMLHGERDSINIKSGFADVTYSGTADIRQMLRDLKSVTIGRDMPALYNNPDEPADSGCYRARIDFHDSRKLLSFLMPDAYIQDGSSITLNADSNRVKATVRSNRLALGANYLKGMSLDADNLGGRLSADIKIDEIGALGMKFGGSRISADADTNAFNLGLQYTVTEKEDDCGDLRFHGSLESDGNGSPIINIIPSNASFTLGGEQWKLSDSEISIGNGNISFKNFNIFSSGRGLELEGGVSRESSDSLDLKLEGINLDLVKKLLTAGPDIKGNLSGHASVISPLNGQYKVLGKIACDSLIISNSNLGDITLAGKWDDRKQAINVFLENRAEGRSALTSYAYITPADNKLSAEVSMDRMSPAIVMPFLSGILDDASGSVSGKIKAEGPLKDLSVETEKLTLDKLKLKLSATGVSYILDGPLDINDRGLVLDGIAISDEAQGQGKLKGVIDMHKLNKVSMNAGLDFKDLLIINCTEKSGQSFYGNLAGSGSASIKGPVSKLNINARLETSGDGSIHIPLGSSVTSTHSDLLTFVQKEKDMDEYESMIASRQEKKQESVKSDISINALIHATPGVKAFIEIDKSTNNILTAFGEGSVKALIRPAKGTLNLEGMYNITGGNYNFQTAAIINKEFSIQSGSSLSFNGPVENSRLDVKALYKLKTSLNTLIADTSSVSSRRAVECGIRISENINNLKFDFSINIPDLDPSTKARVESALNTEDKVQKQFASLLLLGTFLPSEQSGIVNSTNVLYSNVSEMMSGQINSIFQKLDIPVDLGFGYQQNEGGTDIFDVAISTQLFNNRVVINGSVGNRKYSTSSNPYGDVVGDLDIDIKLDKKGQLRATLFSHSADEYSNYLDYSQRNGFGVSYQLEYDKLLYLFNKKKMPDPYHKSDNIKVITVPRNPTSSDKDAKHRQEVQRKGLDNKKQRPPTDSPDAP